LLVNSRRLMAPNIFRTLFYLPTVIPVVAGAIIFNGVLNSQSGWLNLSLKALGITEPPRWFSDPLWAGFALNLLAIWAVGNAMIILLASLQGVPTELYEAATIDGAGPIAQFFYITVPMISPVIFYNLTIGVILAFQYFVPALLIGSSNGNPQGSLLFFPMHFYREAFVFSHMGYASVLAVIIFVVTMAATGLLFYFGQRLVYYASGETS
jgi:multiple sugar transport system permease protein